MTAEPPAAPPADSSSDRGPALAVSPHLSEAEVQSLRAVIHDVKGHDPAETNHWELDAMAPLNAGSIVSFLTHRIFISSMSPDTPGPGRQRASVCERRQRRAMTYMHPGPLFLRPRTLPFSRNHTTRRCSDN